MGSLRPAAALLCLLAGVAAATAAPSGGVEPAAACTAAQKTARAASLTAYLRKMAVERKAYFAKHRSAALRRAFVKRQQTRLTALRAAAVCTVSKPATPLPPSSGSSCSPALRDHFPFRGYLPSIGRANAVMIFVDFPDAVATEQIAGVAQRHTEGFPWFAEASYGRFSLAATPVGPWFRMPRAASAYLDIGAQSGLREFVADAVAASDAAVDYSRYQAVLIVPARGWRQGFNRPWIEYGGPTVFADGGPVRWGTMVAVDIRERGTDLATRTEIHELLHTMGLPDLVGADETAGSWDPMYGDSQRGPSTNHILAWHKWRLGWLEPAQLTCLHAAGQLDETVTPLAAAGGKKAVVLPVGDSLAYFVEVRRRVGYDRTICREGVLVYTVDTSRPSGAGPINVRGPAGRCEGSTASSLGVGERFDDAYVSVEVLATDGSAYRVRVTRK